MRFSTTFIFFISWFFEVNSFLRPRKLEPIDFFKGAKVRANARVSTNWYTQKLDHFNYVDTRTWQQRYYVNEDYYNATSTKFVFLMIGGESEANIRWMTFGPWMDSAKEYGALMFQLEHRYYGESQPFSNLSTENLLYLSTHHALEDLATFITSMNQEYHLPTDVKWILFGGSYPASMGTWMRLKYPHLVAGVIASSGPLNIVFDFHEYLQVVIDDLATHSQTCVDNVQKSFQQLETYLNENKSETYEYVTQTLKLCDAIKSSILTNTKDVEMLNELLIDDNFAYVAQYNKNYGMGNLSTDTLCDVMNNQTLGNEFDRLGNVNWLMLNVTGDTCLNHTYEKRIASYRNVTFDSTKMMRQWYYQTCTEFAFYQTTNQNIQVFGNKINTTFFTDLCIDIFGDNFNQSLVIKNINATNNRYGAKNLHNITNIAHYHGSYDPWYPLGLLETVNEDSPVFFVKGAAHCANMYPARSDEAPQLTATRKEIHKLIGVWLGVNEKSGSNMSKRRVFILNIALILVLIFVL